MTLSLLALLAGHAHAQQAASAVPETDNAKAGVTELDAITVTGTRASMRKSQALKQDAVGTVDAVSAEDVGKFPDQNVADSLQRVPGVSVDRSGGESRFITVRGFGPQFNTVLLNGRTMATENAGREFSFDVLPSELIKSVEVHKTSEASLSEGGIGATVDVRTQRPLDNPGLHLAGSLSAAYDDMAGAAKPKVSGLISDSNADGTFGALLNVVRYQRNHRSELVDTEGWLTGTAGANGIAVPRTLAYKVSEAERTRTGVNAAIDWRPSDSLSVSIDAMHAQYKIDSRTNSLGLFTDPADIQQISANADGTATSFVRRNTGNLATDHVISSSPRDSTNQQFGINVAWQPDDQTTLDVDAAYSKAEDDVAGKSYFIAIGSRNVGVNPTWNLNPGAFPSYSNLLPITDTSNMKAHIAVREGATVSDELGEVKLNLTRIFSESTLSKLQFGVSGSKRTKDSYSLRTSDSELTCAYCGYSVRVPAQMFGLFNAGSIVDGASPGAPRQWLDYDAQRYFAYLASPEAYRQLAPGGEFYDPNDPDRAKRIADAVAKYGGYTPVEVPQNRWQVQEKSYAAYAQATFEGAWAQMPWLLNLGVRYVRTEVTSDALSSQVASITGNPGDPTNAQVNFTPPVPLTRNSSYDDWLPSLNFRLNLRDDLLLRGSASRTLTRPTLTDLRASESITVRPPGPGAFSTGNVDLQPYTATNFDAGIEWYLSDLSYVALAGFYKKVENFITQITVPTTIQGYPFQQTKPVNANQAIIKGAEFSFQYMFDRLPAPFDGLGMQANYTYVTSQQSFDPSIATGQFAVEGLSDSANFVVFYEKGRFGLRAAYNWRDQYLSAVRGSQGEPTTVKPYGQLDLSSNFKLSDNISLFVEATNLTDETEAAWSRYPSRVQWVAANGRTFTLGIRGSW